MNREEIISWLQANLKPNRLNHSLEVERTARKMAQCFGEDPELAALAGLVHDCAKWMSHDTLRMYAPRSDADSFEFGSPALLHAPVGVLVARRDLGITDVRVLNAIRWHTIGGENISTLDRIVFLADLIEPGRNYPGVEAVRALAEKDLTAALVDALSLSISYVLGRRQLVHPTTLYMYNALVADLRRNHQDEQQQLAGAGAFAV